MERGTIWGARFRILRCVEPKRLLELCCCSVEQLPHSVRVAFFQAVQISRASPSWQGYITHVSGVVLDGLKNSTLASLQSMLNQIVFSNMSQVKSRNGCYVSRDRSF